MPDLALRARSADEGRTVLYMFNDIFAAMRSAKIRFSAGDMVEGDGQYWKFRKPRASEGFLDSPRMIVLEPDSSTKRLT
jgi:hypothetical protein